MGTSQDPGNVHNNKMKENNKELESSFLSSSSAASQRNQFFNLIAFLLTIQQQENVQ